MRRPAIDALKRGVANVAANGELVVAQIVQTIGTSLLVLAGLVPFVVVIGVGTLRTLVGAGATAAGAQTPAWTELTAIISESAGALLTATIVACVVWTVALIFNSYFQAGIFGVLAGGDRIAREGAPPRGEFRVFSIERFREAADRGLWRYFFLISVFMFLETLLLSALGGGVLLSVWLFTNESVTGSVVVGCAGIAVAGIGAVAVGFWWQVAMATAANGDRSLGRVLTVSARTLLHRFGAVLVLALLALVVGLTAALLLTPVSFFLEIVFRDSLPAYFAAQILMSVLQSVLSAVVGLVFAGSIVAVVRGEARQVRELAA